MLLRKIVTAAVTLFFTVVLSYTAQAASFDCAKARSKQEKLICSTPALSQADDVMAAKYKEAYAAAGKISREEASQFKENQSSWIITGIGNCKPEVQCLANSYKVRTAFLGFYLQQAQKPMAISGIYFHDYFGRDTAELHVQQKDGSKARFSIAALHFMNRGTPYFTANTGDIAADGALKNNVISYEAPPGDQPCKLQITFSATKTVV